MTVASQQTAVRYRMLERGLEKGDILRIGRPLGVMDVVVAPESETDCGETRFAKLGFVKTARRLMDGLAHVPREPG